MTYPPELEIKLGCLCAGSGCGGHLNLGIMPGIGSAPIPASALVLGTGPRHDTVGVRYEAAVLGERGRSGKIDASTWTGCNGQRCGGQCGPGRSVRLWVPCPFAVGGGHSCHLDDGEIEALRRVTGLVTP